MKACFPYMEGSAVIANHLRTLGQLALVAILCSTLSKSPVAVQKKLDDSRVPWSKAVDGLACRLTVQPRYTVGQPLTAVIEIKNVSDKTRYNIAFLMYGEK